MERAGGADPIEELRYWVRSWAAERLNSQTIEEKRCIPPDVLVALGNKGLLGMIESSPWGGLGLSIRQAARVFEQLGAADMCVATFIANHTLATFPVEHYATDRYRQV